MQTTILRKLSGAQRLAIAIHMSQTVREFSLARIRQRHPEWSDLELKRELLRYAFPPNDLPPPLR
ncbi:MAG: hypothetical protein ACREMY_30550 [bacterium]